MDTPSPDDTYIISLYENPKSKELDRLISDQKFIGSYLYTKNGISKPVDLLEGILLEEKGETLTIIESRHLLSSCAKEMALAGIQTPDNFRYTLSAYVQMSLLSEEESSRLLDIYLKHYKEPLRPVPSAPVSKKRTSVRTKILSALGGAALVAGLGTWLIHDRSAIEEMPEAPAPAKPKPKPQKPAPALEPTAKFRPLETETPLPRSSTEASQEAVTAPEIITEKVEIALLTNPEDSTKGIFNSPMTKMRLRSQGWTILETLRSETGETIIIIEKGTKKGKINITEAQNSNQETLEVKPLN